VNYRLYDILKGTTRWSLKVILGLSIVIVLLLPFSFVGAHEISTNVEKIAKYGMGQTVFVGDEVLDKSNIDKYPIVTNINYLYDRFKTFDIIGIFISISTGTVPLPVSEFSSSGISDSGFAEGFSGPGILTKENNKLVVKPPDNFVWGYKTPYTFAVKSENGIDIVEENQIIKTIGKKDINNDTIPGHHISGESILNWFNKADIGDNVTLDYALSNFSDNRSLIKPDEIKTLFGEEVLNYTYSYPSGSPIMIYMTNYDEFAVTDAYSYLGSYPQYNDANRAYNAKQFVKAWNDTIIPPNSTSSGTEIIGFAVSPDPKAPGGSASHGVCPPARSLRSIALNMGFSLPTGMNGDHNAVNFGVNPGSGIKVTNKLDYPIKIVMWTEGEGTSMIIHAKMIELVPGDVAINTTNTTNNTT
jgi:hypothetical protein